MAWLEIDGKRYEVTTELVVGRSSTCDIALADVNTSRRHARVWVENGGVWVEDLGTQNGTRVNDRRITGRAPLQSGDVIRVGVHQLTFISDQGATAAGAAAGVGPPRQAAPGQAPRPMPRAPQPPPARKGPPVGWIIFGSTAGVILLIVLYIATSDAWDPWRFGMRLRMQSAVINPTLPKMIDSMTRLDRITVGDRSLVYHYTLIGAPPTLGQPPASTRFRKIIAKHISDNEFNSNVLSHHFTITCDYRDPNGKVVVTVPVPLPDDEANAPDDPVVPESADHPTAPSSDQP
jgi:hypothetical protein